MNKSHLHLAACLWVAAFALLYPAHIYCQRTQAGKAPTVDARMRTKLVDNIIRELQAKYVAPEKVKEMETYLRTKLKSGGYDKFENAGQLALALTQDLRSAGRDLHLLI